MDDESVVNIVVLPAIGTVEIVGVIIYPIIGGCIDKCDRASYGYQRYENKQRPKPCSHTIKLLRNASYETFYK